MAFDEADMFDFEQTVAILDSWMGREASAWLFEGGLDASDEDRYRAAVMQGEIAPMPGDVRPGERAYMLGDGAGLLFSPRAFRGAIWWHEGVEELLIRSGSLAVAIAPTIAVESPAITWGFVPNEEN